jgi:hypothetical protein
MKWIDTLLFIAAWGLLLWFFWFLLDFDLLMRH